MTAHLNNNSRTLFKKAHQYTVQDSLTAHCSRQLIKAIIQEQMAAFIEQTDKSKVAVQKALDEAQLLFDSLMQKYFG